jgi:hypothetical protein
MRQLLQLAVSVSILTFCVGCVEVVQAVRLDNEIRPVKSGVHVYTSFETVPWRYKEIALIVADDQGNGYSEPQLIEGIIHKARMLGADAVVITSQSSGTAGYLMAPIGNMYGVAALQQRIVRGTAIIRVWE